MVTFMENVVGGREAAHDSMNIRNLLNRLEGVKRDGKGWKANCPAHDDQKPSLTITEEKDKVLLYCHAGCRVQEVVGAIGLQMADLFLESATKTRLTGMKGEIVATYDYTDAAGRLLFQAVRFQPKDFRQRRPDGAGGWVYNLKGVSPVLFRLPRVVTAAAKAERIFVVEGEKDVLTLEAVGLVATCNPMGAGKWRKEYARCLRGAHVVVFPDNDPAGQAHAATVAQSLQGEAATIRLIALPGLSLKGDVSDWLRAGHSREELLALVDAAPEWAPETTASAGIPLTDLGNAERLIGVNGENLRFHTNAQRWLTWTGSLWKLDETGEVFRLAKRVVRGMYQELERIDGSQERESLHRHILKSESESRIQAMVSMAEWQPGIPVTVDDLDGNPWGLNCVNGTLDLRTGVLRPHRREDMLTKLCPVSFDATATCSRWERFLAEVFSDDREVSEYVQRLMGYCLTGDTREHALFFFVGKGANGKSVLLETIRSLLGDYARDTAFSTFLDRRDTATNDLAALQGARLVTASEGDGATTFNESLLKRLSGGDSVTCRFLHREFFSYTPGFKIGFATNEVPRLTSQGYAMRRRLHIIPFDRTFYAPEDGKQPVRDETLRERLRDELPGILAWAVRGCLSWQAQGLHPPARVIEETQELFESFDSLADFLDECCTIHPRAQVESGTLWSAYLDWCDAQSRQPAFRQPNGFSRNLSQREGVDSRKGSKGVRFLSGIGLRA
jgi:putative DNA primase/helicase